MENIELLKLSLLGDLETQRLADLELRQRMSETLNKVLDKSLNFESGPEIPISCYFHEGYVEPTKNDGENCCCGCA